MPVRFLLVLCAFVVLSGSALARTPWEITVMFFGARENVDYQHDIDKNIMELARLRPTAELRLSLYRELPTRNVAFFPEHDSQEQNPLKHLLSDFNQDVKIWGEMAVSDRKAGDVSLLSRPEELKRFLAKAFRIPKSKRVLVIYGHGLGHEGLQVIPLVELRKSLKDSLPARRGKAVDILWLDACFMATIEVLHELGEVASRIIASEEAEFSSGAPFDSLQDLLEKLPDEIDPVATGMAERFLESYSFIKHGSQTEGIYRSSATVSLVDPDRIPGLFADMRKLTESLKKLPDGWKPKLERRLSKIQMDKGDLVDFGSLLTELKKGGVLESTEAVDALIRRLEIGRPADLRTNPRILARAPKQGSRLVYGYEAWKRGNKGDEDVLGKLPSNLKPTEFVSGPNRKEWPSREVNIRLYLAPFTVGLREFNFFFADPGTGKTLSAAESHKRVTDFVVRRRVMEANPVLFSGYTQGVGATAERYTGMAILAPLRGVPSVDYLDLGFFQATEWAQF